MVEMLNVAPPSPPPVPLVSSSGSESRSSPTWTVAAFSRMARANPSSSSAVSPLVRRPIRNAEIWGVVAWPFRMTSMASCASAEERFSRAPILWRKARSMEGFASRYHEFEGLPTMKITAVMAGVSLIAILRAQENPAPEAPPHQASAEASKPALPPPVDTSSITKHSIQINGKSLAYTATAGTLVIQKDAKPWASMFYVAYTLDGVQDLSKRPITFAFNGGPGSSSVWLHLGALGPKRIAMGPDGEQPKPPYHLVDNEDTALQFTDLVFIDPVTTGFSRAAPGEKEAQFHGFDGDLESVAEFIRLYSVRAERW